MSEVQSSISIPLLRIAEATAKEIKRKKLSTVALLGTKYKKGAFSLFQFTT
ncbi:MAG: hypothetical protein M3352_05950 [Bacteroidota bacterium]|nr:hypothetical protein [Bacteroidota bacterium]